MSNFVRLKMDRAENMGAFPVNQMTFCHNQINIQLKKKF